MLGVQCSAHTTTGTQFPCSLGLTGDSKRQASVLRWLNLSFDSIQSGVWAQTSALRICFGVSFPLGLPRVQSWLLRFILSDSHFPHRDRVPAWLFWLEVCRISWVSRQNLFWMPSSSRPTLNWEIRQKLVQWSCNAFRLYRLQFSWSCKRTMHSTTKILRWLARPCVPSWCWLCWNLMLH